MQDKHIRDHQANFRKGVLSIYGDSGIQKSETTTLEKGGEGSKGGKVIGHTKSGKAIYDSVHQSYTGFNKQEHAEAAKLHRDKAGEHDFQNERTKETTAGYKDSDGYQERTKLSKQHTKLADFHDDHGADAPDGEEAGSKIDWTHDDNSKTLADRYKEVASDNKDVSHDDVVASMKESHNAPKKHVEAALAKHGVKRIGGEEVKKSEEVNYNSLEKSRTTAGMNSLYGEQIQKTNS